MLKEEGDVYVSRIKMTYGYKLAKCINSLISSSTSSSSLQAYHLTRRLMTTFIVSVDLRPHGANSLPLNPDIK